MATLGITYFLDGLGQTIFGSDIYKIDIGMPKDPCSCLRGVFEGGILINKEDLIAAAIAAALVIPAEPVLPENLGTGRALRAVADDHQAAQSIGIPLNRIWVIVWCVAGIRGAGGRHDLGQQAGRAVLADLVALKALPVVILGGLTSVPGAIIGGLIIGVGEKLSEVYIGPIAGRRHRDLVRLRAGLVFLLVPAAGAVRREDHRPRVRQAQKHFFILKRNSRPCSTAKTASSRPATAPISRSSPSPRTASAICPAAGLRAFRRAVLADEYMFRAILIPFPDPVAGGAGREHPGGLLRPDLAGLGRLHGGGRLCGLQLLGAHRRHAADLAAMLLGGFLRHAGGHAVRHSQPAHQGPVPGGGHAGGAVLCRLGLPARILVHQQLSSGSVSVSNLQVFGCPSTRRSKSTCSAWLRPGVFAWLAKNLVRSHIGREWMAIRDMDVAAAVIGIRPVYAKLTAFAVSSFIVGVAGGAVGLCAPGLLGAGGVLDRPVVPACCSWSSSAAWAPSWAASSARPSS